MSKRKQHHPEFKGEETVSELASRFGVYPEFNESRSSGIAHIRSGNIRKPYIKPSFLNLQLCLAQAQSRCTAKRLNSA